MLSNSFVFSLIKGLTMSEKRYFKVNAGKNMGAKSNKYLLLFDELDCADVENDEVLKSVLSSNGFSNGYLAADKNYLYGLLLRTLNDFHYGKTLNISIKEKLISIEILFNKGLYKQCYKAIVQAEKLATDCQNFQLIIDLLNWKKRCAGYSAGLNEAFEINTQINKYIKLLINLKLFTDLYYQSNLLQANNEKNIKAKIEIQFKAIISNAAMKSEKKALSKSAKIFYHLIYSNYYHVLDNKRKEIYHLKKLTCLIKKSKGYTQENPIDYVSIYNRLLSVKKHFAGTSFFEDLKTLKEFGSNYGFRNEVISQRTFIHCITNELEYYLLNGDLKKAVNLIHENDSKTASIINKIEPYHIIHLFYLFIITSLYGNNFAQALKYTNVILNDFNRKDRPATFDKIEIMNALIHYEMGTFTLVFSLSRQILKKNRQTNHLDRFEEEFLKTLAKISGSRHPEGKIAATILSNLLEVLEQLKGGKKDKGFDLYGYYREWLTIKTISNLNR